MGTMRGYKDSCNGLSRICSKWALAQTPRDSTAAALLEVADDSEIELLNVALKTHGPRNASPSPALRWCKVDGVADEAKQTWKER
jgi:hypothetical protein